MSAITNEFTEYRPACGVDDSWVVHDLDAGYRVKIPGAQFPRWIPGRSSVHLLSEGLGSVSAHLWGAKLSVEQTTVNPEYRREGVATEMMSYLFAVATQHGATVNSGVVFNCRPLGMYVKMFGAENIRLGERSTNAGDVAGVIAELPDWSIRDEHYCAYEIDLANLRPEYVRQVPDTTIDPND